MPDRYDLADRRHQLKLVRDSGDAELYENRDGLDCPVCGRVYGSVFASEKRGTSFDPDGAVPFCVRREPDRILLFTHD